MKNALILLAGGISSRTNSEIPKQFVEVDGTPIFVNSILPFIDYVDVIAVSCTKDYIEYVESILSNNFKNKKIIVVEGGKTGLESTLNGFNSLKEISNLDYVFIHDAARPFLSKGTIDNCLEGLINKDYVFSSAKMCESVFNSSAKTVEKKDNLYRIMSPHAFRYNFLKNLLQNANETNEPTIFNYMMKENFEVNVVETDETNFKITTSKQLEFAVKLLK